MYFYYPAFSPQNKHNETPERKTLPNFGSFRVSILEKDFADFLALISKT